MVTASGFTQELGSLTNIPIANVLYSYDTPEGETLILESNNAIYLGKNGRSLMNPIQSEEIGVCIDTQTQKYYPEIWIAQSISFLDGTIIKVKYDGVLPFIPICCPTQKNTQLLKVPVEFKGSLGPLSL